jgi:phosphate transport system substrate-binding protein
MAGACSGSGFVREHSGVTVKGSDTMLDLNRRLAAAYMRAHPGVAVRIEGGGTRSGVEALVAGEADLAAASRPLTPAEVASIYDSFETLGVGYLLARDALSIYLHPDNPVRDLSLDEVRDIFTGAIIDWSEVGGLPQRILVVIRPPSSGSFRFFRDHVLRGASYTALAAPGVRTADVVTAVRGNPAAVGFGGIAYGADLVHCAIDGIDPTEENLREGRYALARYLVFYAPAPPEEHVHAFVEWCLGPEGQEIVREVGFIPLWAAQP